MKEILLTQGQVALVDDADFEWLDKMSWCANKSRCPRWTFYAGTVIKGETIRMHRLILGLKLGDERQCDHIDDDGLNNQRANLRVCTASENVRNQKKRAGGSSRYKGVAWDKERRKWRARIDFNKKTKYLGHFSLESDAARCYDTAAMEYFGKFARTNFN